MVIIDSKNVISIQVVKEVLSSAVWKDSFTETSVKRNPNRGMFQPFCIKKTITHPSGFYDGSSKVDTNKARYRVDGDKLYHSPFVMVSFPGGELDEYFNTYEDAVKYANELSAKCFDAPVIFLEK